MSRQEPLDALEAQLEAKPPSGVGRLSAKELEDLAGLVRGARRAQAADLKAAGDKAFAQIPWLLRGPIRKIMS